MGIIFLLQFFLFTSTFAINQTAILDLVNYYRKLHSAPPVTYNVIMDPQTQIWAQHLATTNTLVHSVSGGLYGENLGMTSFGGIENIIKLWYDEINNYNFSNPGYSIATGHFTQLVWVGTNSISVASYSGQGGVFIVMRFYPAGNVLGLFKGNVLPLRVEPPISSSLEPKNQYLCICEC